jgi:hypothetical protein
MRKLSILLCTGFALVWALYVGYLLRKFFNHRTALGDKTNIPNCQVLLRIGDNNERLYSNETIQIHTVTQGIKMVEAET